MGCIWSMKIFIPSVRGNSESIEQDRKQADEGRKDNKLFVLKIHHRVAALIKRAVRNSISQVGLGPSKMIVQRNSRYQTSGLGVSIFHLAGEDLTTMGAYPS